MRGFLVAVALACAATTGVGPARGDAASAQKLFDEGKKMLDAGNWPDACKKFRASMELDPSVGTLLNVGNCHAHEGKVHSAQNDFERALKMNQATADTERRKSVEKYARGKIAELLKRVPTLEVEVEPRPKGLEVTRNGTKLPLVALGEALPVDPGVVEVVARAPGWQGRGRIRLEERQHEQLMVKLNKASTDSGSQDDGSVPVWAWVTMGGGVVLGAVAVGFAVDYANAVNELDKVCGPDLTCPAEFPPEPLNARKNRDAVAGGVLGGVGGAALLTGVIGAIVGASSGKDDPSSESAVGFQLGPHVAGLQLYGRFE